MRTTVLVGLLAGLMLLGGCKSWRENACRKPQPYQSATTGAPLTIPPGLAAPDTANALKLPVLNEPAPPPRKNKDPCLEEPPSFKVPKSVPPAPQA
jgi:uncharacterized lipoprotein